MYTRCPSCRSEISFEPPANLESLPDGYKHRIKCPSCGVTIGVKINKVEAAPVQPTFVPRNPQATSFEPVYNAGPVEAAPVAQTKVKPAKKSGVSRNVMIMILALLFIGLAIVGYLINNETITVPEGYEWVESINIFDGISTWETIAKDPKNFELNFQEINLMSGETRVTAHSFGIGLVNVTPWIVFSLSCVSFIIAFICACCKKYSRVFNLIMGILIGGFAIVAMFAPLIIMNEALFVLGQEKITVADWFNDVVIEGQMYFHFVIAGLGFLQILFSCIFLKSLKRKRA